MLRYAFFIFYLEPNPGGIFNAEILKPGGICNAEMLKPGGICNAAVATDPALISNIVTKNTKRKVADFDKISNFDILDLHAIRYDPTINKMFINI